MQVNDEKQLNNIRQERKHILGLLIIKLIPIQQNTKIKLSLNKRLMHLCFYQVVLLLAFKNKIL